VATKRNGKVITAITVISVLGAMGGLAAVHTTWVLPSVLKEAHEMMRAEIKDHSRYPHPVSVSRMEFQMLLETVQRIETKVDRIGR